MAKFPSAEQLGIRQPSAIPGVSDVRGAFSIPEFEAAGVSAEVVQQEREKMDRKELATARVQFQLATIAEAQKYDQDDDLDTIEERYYAGMNEGLANAAQNITSSELRQAFIEEAGVSVAEANARMSEQVFNRKADRERGYMANAIQEIVRGTVNMEEGHAGMTTGQQLVNGVIAVQSTVESMAERGIMQNEEAQAIIRRAQDEMALGKLKAMPPEKQLLALQEDWVRNIDPAVRQKLQQEAEAQAEEQAALDQAFEIAELSEGEGLALLREKYADDFELYDRMKLRFLEVKTDQTKVRQAQQDDFFEDHFFDVYMGNRKVNEIPGLDDASLNSAQLSNLLQAQDNAIRRAAGEAERQISDPAVLDELDRFIANDQLVKAKQFWSENYAKLNRRDMYFYRGMLTSKRNTEEFKPIRTVRQHISEFEANNGKMDGEERSLMLNRLQDKARAYYNNKGENPPPDVMDKWLRQEYIGTTLEKPWWRGGDDDRFVYEMGPEDRALFERQVPLIQELGGGLSTEDAAVLWSGYNQEQYEALDRIFTTPDQAGNVGIDALRARYPDDTDAQIWYRIQWALGEKGGTPRTVPAESRRSGAAPPAAPGRDPAGLDFSNPNRWAAQ